MQPVFVRLDTVEKYANYLFVTSCQSHRAWLHFLNVAIVGDRMTSLHTYKIWHWLPTSSIPTLEAVSPSFSHMEKHLKHQESTHKEEEEEEEERILLF